MNLGEPGRLWPLMALFDRELRWKGAREVVLARVLARALARALLLESPRPPPIAWYRDRRRPPPYASALQGCCIKSSSLPPSNLPIFPRDAMDGSSRSPLMGAFAAAPAQVVSSLRRPRHPAALRRPRHPSATSRGGLDRGSSPPLVATTATRPATTLPRTAANPSSRTLVSPLRTPSLERGGGDGLGGPDRGRGRGRIALAWLREEGDLPSVLSAAKNAASRPIAVALPADAGRFRAEATRTGMELHVLGSAEAVVQSAVFLGAKIIAYGVHESPERRRQEAVLSAAASKSVVSLRPVFLPGSDSRLSVPLLGALLATAATSGGVLGAAPEGSLSADSAGPPAMWEVAENGSRKDYRFDADGQLMAGTIVDTRSPREKMNDLLTKLFLPDGYPATVTSEYLSFSKWRGVQNLASAVMAVVSTEALLFGLGLGKATVASAAAAQWILKDGAGYVAKVWYGSVAGKLIDTDPKSYRLMADGLEDVGGALEILTPLFPNYFLALASLATALKAVAGMTGTATRHSIYRSLGRARHNVGEIASKGESQGVVLKLGGLAMGLTVSSAIGQRYFLLLSTYSACAAIHLAANWQAMRCVQFTSLNRQRSAIVMNAYLDAVLSADAAAAQTPPLSPPSHDHRSGGPLTAFLNVLHVPFPSRGRRSARERGRPSSLVIVPDPRAVSGVERILLPPWVGWQPSIVLGASVAAACPSRSSFTTATTTFRGERWFAVAGSNDAAAPASAVSSASTSASDTGTDQTRTQVNSPPTATTTVTTTTGNEAPVRRRGRPSTSSLKAAAATRGGVLNVVFHRDASDDDKLRAFFFAQVHARTPTSMGERERMDTALAVSRRHFGPWLDAARSAGWEVSYPMLGDGPARLAW